MIEPTEKDGAGLPGWENGATAEPWRGQPRLAVPAVRDPFLDLTDARARAVQRVLAALEGVFPPGTYVKIDNLIVNNGKPDGAAVVLVLRKP